MTMSITHATAADADAIAALLEASALPLDGARACLGNAVVAADGDRVVGCAALELHGSDALLRSVAVDATHRGHGAGRRLVTAALDLAEERGVTTVYLLTTTAEAFFHHLGFERVGREVVPDAVRASIEFTTACPASAAVMRREVRQRQG